MNYEAYEAAASRRIGTLGGIGIRRAELFARLGIYTVGDLLRHFPRAYQNRGHILLLADAPCGENCSFLLTVGTQPRSVMLKNRKTLTKFSAFDESGSVVITYFNNRFVEKVFQVGRTYRFWGKLSKEKGRFAMASPQYEPWREGGVLPDIVPIYPSAAGLTQRIISDAVREALSLIDGCRMPPVLPEEFRIGLGLPAPDEALRRIHCAGSLADVERARRYFSVEELYLFSLGLSLTKNRRRSGTPPAMKPVDLTAFLGALGFPPTGAQSRSIREIAADMTEAEVPMARLLSGDVGSGKTAVCAAAICIALQNGFQAALMAPTEILAVQHYDSLSPLFEGLGYRVSLLVGSSTASQKRAVKEALAAGETDLVIGTHALLTPDTVFSRLGLVVTDEQHRFGVAQRARLGGNGEISPHVLVMSATPIPRTLALILYGELSLSMLDELPPGRQRVDTYVVDERYRLRLNRFIEKQAEEGGQVYIVCPTVEASDEEELEGDVICFAPDGSAEFRLRSPGLKSATEYAAMLQKEVFPSLKVGLVHGKMKGSEKAAVMKAFAEGTIQILVSTTVIEVGVNVPNASLMIVENAERFGLAQLHQLRGRVGRGARKAYCVLVSSSGGEKAEKRLSVMKTTYDGYRIAEYDLSMRGPGDYFPTGEGAARQHGSFGALLSADMTLFRETMRAAGQVIAADPDLTAEENRFAAGRMRALLAVDERAMQ